MDDDARKPDRDETTAERIDRNWGELLQELRVTQTGVQILFAFLLVLPFQQRFEMLESVDRWMYVAVMTLITMSTVLNLAPVITHRILFAQHKKDQLMQVSDLLAKASFVALGLALLGAIVLVIDVVAGRAWALGVAAGVGSMMLGLWIVLPALILRRPGSEGSKPGY